LSLKTAALTSPRVLSPMTLSVLGAFVTSRLLCSAFVYLGHTHRPFLAPVPGGWEGVANWWLNPWTTFDSQWYLEIAAQGYQAHSTAFFPFYPWLLSFCGDHPVRMAAWGVMISHLSLLAALWLLFRLTEIEWGARHAHVAVWILAYSPIAPFFGAVYTESLFLALMAGTFLAVRQKRWWLAGLLGMLTALLRNPGFFIAGALLLEAFENRQDAKPGQWVAWLFPLGAFFAVQLWFWQEYGSPLAGVDSQSFYHRQPAWPWQPLTGDLTALLSGKNGLIFYLVAGAGVLASLGGLYLAFFEWRRFRGPYLLLVGGITLMNLCMMRQVLPHTISAVRYMGGLFPVAQIGAWYLINSLSRWPKVRLLLIGLQLYLFVIFSYLFGIKCFLG
jgi:hypothetical protein